MIKILLPQVGELDHNNNNSSHTVRYKSEIHCLGQRDNSSQKLCDEDSEFQIWNHKSKRKNREQVDQRLPHSSSGVGSQNSTDLQSLLNSQSDCLSQSSANQYKNSSYSSRKHCSKDMNCGNLTCVFIHSTETTRSPAFELQATINSSQQPKQQSQAYPYQLQQPQPMNGYQQHQQQQYVGVPQPQIFHDMPNPYFVNPMIGPSGFYQFPQQIKLEDFEFPYKEYLKESHIFDISDALTKIKNDYQNILISFDLKEKDKLKVKLNTVSETCKEVKEKIELQLLEEKVYILQNKHINAKEFSQQFRNHNKRELQGKKVFIEGKEPDQYYKQRFNDSNFGKKNKDNENPKVVIYAPKYQKNELKETKDLIVKYHDEQYKSDYHLFLGSTQMAAYDKFLKYHYLKKVKAIEDLLNRHYMRQARISLNYDDYAQTIKARLTYNEFQKLKYSLWDLVNSLSTQEVFFKSYIVVHFTLLHDYKTLHQKAEGKFRVNITDQVDIEESKASYSNHSKYSKCSKGSQFNKDHQAKCSFKKYFVPKNTKINSYTIVVTGEDTAKAVQYLHQQLSQYHCKIEEIPSLKDDVFKEFQEKLPEIAKKRKVILKYEEGEKKLYLIGKMKDKRMNDAWDEIDAIINKKDQIDSVKVIDFPEDSKLVLHQILKDRERLFKMIKKEHNVTVKLEKSRISLQGPVDKLDFCYPQVALIVKESLDMIKIKIIDNLNHLITYDMLQKKNFNFFDEYKVIAKKETMQKARKVTESQKANQQFINDQQKSQVTVAQWAYKVYRTDPNYNQRTDKANDWFEFDGDQNFQIEAFYKECCASKNFGQKQEVQGDQQRVKNGFTYEVYGKDSDPSSWVEVNMQTNRSRQLQRRIIEKEEKKKFEVKVEESKMRAYQDEFDQNDDQVLTIIGLESDIEAIITFFVKYYSDPTNHIALIGIKELKVTGKIIKELIVLAEKRFQVKIEESKQELKITGFNCNQAQKEILELADKTRALNFPSYWDDVINIFENPIQIMDLNKSTVEYQDIVKQFQETMPKANILKIERIQIKSLWRIYQAERENIIERNGQSDKLEKLLYHGTRQTDPALIYNGSEGFDSRFSGQGMWGEAVYFAQNASYSHNYKSTKSPGVFQMFCARVLVANFIVLSSDSSLKVPPLLPGSQTRRYDSVKGYAGGSDVYMIFRNKQAYPEYLITYQ